MISVVLHVVLVLGESVFLALALEKIRHAKDENFLPQVMEGRASVIKNKLPYNREI